jgi:hypothetical protein
MSRCFFMIPLVLAATAAGQTVSSTAPAAASIPSAAAQARAQDLVHGLFKADFAKGGVPERRALAKTLLAQASETADDLAARYVLLVDALDLSTQAGDARTAFAAISRLTDGYAGIDGLALQREALQKSLLAPPSPADAEVIARLALDTAAIEAARDEFEAVQQLAAIAESAAGKSRQVRVAGAVGPRVEALRGLAAEYAEVQAAQTRIARLKSDDPEVREAHWVIGRFYALHKGQWEVGLRHLALSGDPVLRKLALMELDRPTADAEQLALADGWWDFGKSATGITRDYATAHAIEWYKSVQHNIQGITLTRIESRISASGSAPPATSPAARGVDLLALVDPAKDAVQGDWKRAAGGELIVGAASYATLTIPYQPSEEYDLRVTFTRKSGTGPVALLLASQKRAFEFVIDIKGEARFERINNKVAQDNPTVVPVSISNGHRYTLTVQVRKDRVRALLDDKLLCEHKSDLRDLSRYNVWKSLDTNLCGIGAHNAAVTFHAVDLVEVTGKGRATR